MNTDNKTVREKALEWFKNMTDLNAQKYCLKYKHLIGDDRIVTHEIKEAIYLSEHPEETPKEQTKGVIEGLEDAAIKHANECYDDVDYTEIATNVNAQWDNRKSNFEDGANWHRNTHYMPLLEIFREFLKVSEMYIDNVNNYPDFKMGKGSTITHYFNTVIEKANNYLKQ